jgi:hypothetical protein
MRTWLDGHLIDDQRSSDDGERYDLARYQVCLADVV